MPTRIHSKFLKAELISSVLLFLMALIVFFIPALSFPKRPQMLPLAAATFLLVLIAIEIIIEIRKIMTCGKDRDSQDVETTSDHRAIKKLLLSLGTFVVCTALTFVIGLIPSLTIMCGTLTFVFSDGRRTPSLISGLAGGVIAFTVFYWLLKVPVPMGLLSGWLF